MEEKRTIAMASLKTLSPKTREKRRGSLSRVPVRGVVFCGFGPGEVGEKEEQHREEESVSEEGKGGR